MRLNYQSSEGLNVTFGLGLLSKKLVANKIIKLNKYYCKINVSKCHFSQNIKQLECTVSQIYL